MLKIWQVNVKNGSKMFTCIQEAKTWAEKNCSHPRDHPIRWNTSEMNFELRDTVKNEVVAMVIGQAVEEPKNIYTGEVKTLHVKFPFEKLEKGMKAHFTRSGRILTISYLHQVGVQMGRIITNDGEFVYDEYAYSIVTLVEAIKIEDDPLKKLAYQILAGDPQACDAARDILKC